MRSRSRGKATASRLGVFAIVFAILWFTVAKANAPLSRAPRVITVGSNWSRGYIVVPQRAGTSAKVRKGQSDRAALLARQRGLAVVADADAKDVSVVQGK
jgi:hypothetical protein